MIPHPVLHQTAGWCVEPTSTFELCVDEISVAVPANLKDIRLAANLAIFDIALPGATGFVHNSFIPLSTASTLEARR
jgi:hypothetical protein